MEKECVLLSRAPSPETQGTGAGTQKGATREQGGAITGRKPGRENQQQQGKNNALQQEEGKSCKNLKGYSLSYLCGPSR